MGAHRPQVRTGSADDPGLRVREGEVLDRVTRRAVLAGLRRDLDLAGDLLTGEQALRDLAGDRRDQSRRSGAGLGHECVGRRLAALPLRCGSKLQRLLARGKTLAGAVLRKREVPVERAGALGRLGRRALGQRPLRVRLLCLRHDVDSGRDYDRALQRRAFLHRRGSATGCSGNATPGQREGQHQ